MRTELMNVRTLCAVLAVLVCSLLPVERASSAEDLRSSAQSVLDAHVNAIATGDKQKFMDTVDPNAPDAFKAAQSNEFDGLRSLPLQNYRLVVRTDDSGDLGPGLGVAQKHGAALAYLPETRQIYRLGSYDDRDAVDSYWYTYVQRQGHWYIAADDDAETIGLTSSAELWDHGTVAVQTLPHFLVITMPDAAREAQRSETSQSKR